MNIVSSCRMKEIDRKAIAEWGIPALVLMENAGIRILELSRGLVEFKNKPVVCIAGGGNNGGDALVIARQLLGSDCGSLTVVSTSVKGTAERTIHLDICRNLGIKVLEYPSSGAEEALQSAGIIFDGIAGTGIKGAIKAPISQLIELINDLEAVKFAIDVPSGTGEGFQSGYPALRADYTMTVGLPKRSLFLPGSRGFCGDIHTVSIGFPDELKNEKAEPDGIECELITDDYIENLMPRPAGSSFKNRRGHLAVFAGSRGTTGAASLCAEAAIRTSAGLVSLLPDENLFDIYAARHKSVMVKPLPSGGILPDLSAYSAIAAGPGWGVSGRKGLLLELIRTGRGVIDADGINVLASMAEAEQPDLGGRWILTPHPGEFKRLFPDADIINRPYSEVTAAARRLNCVILLKGHVSYIAEPGGRCGVLDGNYPKLGTAGSGDLLTGLIGGYAASGMEPFDAAVLGAAVHLRAARRCGAEHDWFSSEDLIEYL